MTDYNGWTNYETWNTALWCDNEYAIYKARICNSNMFFSSYWKAEDVKEFVEAWFPDGTPDIQSLPYDDRNPINWKEIADNWNEEMDE